MRASACLACHSVHLRSNAGLLSRASLHQAGLRDDATHIQLLVPRFCKRCRSNSIMAVPFDAECGTEYIVHSHKTALLTAMCLATRTVTRATHLGRLHVTLAGEVGVATPQAHHPHRGGSAHRDRDNQRKAEPQDEAGPPRKASSAWHMCTGVWASNLSRKHCILHMITTRTLNPRSGAKNCCSLHRLPSGQAFLTC